MLPDLVLDNEEYEDILNEAIHTVVSIFPEWTDFNEHDPGITMLELFAMLKESQQFFMDQVGEESRKKFLKLLGLARRRKKAAQSIVKIQTGDAFSLLYRHKILSGDICFENESKKQILAEDICACISMQDNEIQSFVNRAQMEFGGRLQFYPFGNTVFPGGECYICFSEELPVQTPLDIYVEVNKGYSVQRNPLNGFEFAPLAVVSWEYYAGGEWKALPELKDETQAFLFDGFVHFSLEETMEFTSVAEQEGYFIRAVYDKGEYDVVPVITKISANMCEVVQNDTLVENVIYEEARRELFQETELSVFGRSEVYLRKNEVFYPVEAYIKEICESEGKARFEIQDNRLEQADGILVINRDLKLLYKRIAGEGNGFPYQEIRLDDLQVSGERFSILVQDVNHTDGYCFWEQVEDFSQSSPEDKHFVLDSQKGVICFGDCIHGMAPEGKIVLAGYVRTMGTDGNVKKGKINRFAVEALEQIEVRNICDGYGGLDEETLDESFLRARQYLKSVECAVTRRDYEKFVRQTPGLLIESCQVLQGEAVKRFAKNADDAAVYVVVKPYGWEPGRKAMPGYYRNIRGYVEKYRMLGNRIFVDFPEYAEIDVYTEVIVKPQYLHVEKLLQEAVRDFFAQYRDAFGVAITFQALYGFLDRQEFVEGIRSLNMDARNGNVRRNAEGDILLPPHGLAMLREIKTSLIIS